MSRAIKKTAGVERRFGAIGRQREIRGVLIEEADQPLELCFRLALLIGHSCNPLVRINSPSPLRA